MRATAACRFLMCLAACRALVVRLEAGERECFGVEVKAEAAVSGNFELLSPNDKAEPLSVVVTGQGEDDRPLYESVSQPEGTFAFDARADGILDLCIANGKKGASDGLARSIGFAIRMTSQRLELDGDPASEGSLESLLDVSEQLNEDLLTLTDHQGYMRRREETHRATLASTARRVLCWTAAESVVLVALSVWQIMYIRSFFEKKRKM
ncbi:emp24/gp25L/p24 family/GOLD-domain-containing protein [Pelagophyceae sp. CCMP2097]|nr:emp24/gp25L/p24 family/GOLD-domain-containing protein [Pelagophyceae sp. CCMP2097]